jgi:hypothetical protein
MDSRRLANQNEAAGIGNRHPVSNSLTADRHLVEEAKRIGARAHLATSVAGQVVTYEGENVAPQLLPVPELLNDGHGKEIHRGPALHVFSQPDYGWTRGHSDRRTSNAHAPCGYQNNDERNGDIAVAPRFTRSTPSNLRCR